MRLRPMLVVVALFVAACGGASESSVGTSSSSSEPAPVDIEAVEVVADELISVMGGERAALAAVLLAGDLGYGAAQIVPAGVEGRLQPDGLILTADGSTVMPDYEPSRMLDDDVTGEASGVSGFRSPPPRLPLTRFMEAWNREAGGPRGGLVLFLMFLDQGYSPEQLILAMLAGDSPDFRSNSDNSAWYIAIPLRLVDENGEVIEPERSPEPEFADLLDLPSPPDPPTTTTVAPTASTDPDVTAPTVAGADGAADEAPLGGTWYMVWTNAEGDIREGFTIRFIGVDTGTIEILNDETETDTFFELDGDVLLLGFTRPGRTYNDFTMPDDVNFFAGALAEDGVFYGEWIREGWSCSTVEGVCEPDISKPVAFLFREDVVRDDVVSGG